MKKGLGIGICMAIGSCLFAQGEERLARVAFYNVENFFDYFEDSLKNDDAFTPRGANGWTRARYERKCLHLFKAISALGGQEPPLILGLCEVENAKVLRDLLRGTPLRSYPYAFVHHESADSRGIDVALLYRTDGFRLLEERALPLIYLGDSLSRTRDFLYVKGLVGERDTLHLFVCHFPSKYGGLLQTIPKRAHAARVLRRYWDSIVQENPKAFVLAMGDFNDEPLDESLREHFGARCDMRLWEEGDPINLMAAWVGKKGSHKYREKWSLIDQMMVSYPLYSGEALLSVKSQKAFIFEADFLRVEDRVHMGTKMFRTYSGPRYIGGFSDHLPIYLDLRQRQVDSKSWQRPPK